MKTAGLICSGLSVLSQAVPTTAPDVAKVLDYGGLGALFLVLFIVFLKILPSHQATIEKQAEAHRTAAEKVADAHSEAVSTLVKEHKEGLRIIADSHERACDKIVNEIKTCRTRT